MVEKSSVVELKTLVIRVVELVAVVAIVVGFADIVDSGTDKEVLNMIIHPLIG